MRYRTEDVCRQKAADAASHEESTDSERNIATAEHRHQNADDFHRREDEDRFLAAEPSTKFNRHHVQQSREELKIGAGSSNAGGKKSRFYT